MADDHIRYDILAQDALRGVMRKVLAEVARTGLPGNHHFFITFLTNAPGVRVSSRLRERYPEQMTIVLQFQYWDLKVTETGFEVGLSFSDVPEKLEVPFAAVRGFYDPSVNFELEFDVKPERGTPAGRSAGGKEAGARRDKGPGDRRQEGRSRAPRPNRRPKKPVAKADNAPEGRRRRLARRLPQEVAPHGRDRQPAGGAQAQGPRRGCTSAPPRRTGRCSAAAKPKSNASAARRTRRAAFLDGHRRDRPDGK